MSTPRAEVVTGVLVALPAGAYRLQVRWRTRVADDAVVARWLLSPQPLRRHYRLTGDGAAARGGMLNQRSRGSPE
jgi:hypothetical protein